MSIENTQTWFRLRTGHGNTLFGLSTDTLLTPFGKNVAFFTIRKSTTLTSGKSYMFPKCNNDYFPGHRLSLFVAYLVCCPSMYNGFDEYSQVLSGLPGLVSFEADAQACRAGVIKRHLKHELLLTALQNKASHTGQLVLLGARGKVMEVETGWGDRGQLIGRELSPKAKLKAFPFERIHHKELFS